MFAMPYEFGLLDAAREAFSCRPFESSEPTWRQPTGEARGEKLHSAEAFNIFQREAVSLLPVQHV